MASSGVANLPRCFPVATYCWIASSSVSCAGRPFFIPIVGNSTSFPFMFTDMERTVDMLPLRLRNIGRCIKFMFPA